MAYGLLGTGQAYRQQADAALGQVATNEANREIANDQAAAMRKQGMLSGAAMGGILGGTGGLAALGIAGGPVGVLAGAAGGIILGSIF